jgi:hypothetical protein
MYLTWDFWFSNTYLAALPDRRKFAEFGHPDFNLTTVLNDVVPDVTRMRFYSIGIAAFSVTG